MHHRSDQNLPLKSDIHDNLCKILWFNCSLSMGVHDLSYSYTIIVKSGVYQCKVSFADPIILSNKEIVAFDSLNNACEQQYR